LSRRVAAAGLVLALAIGGDAPVPPLDPDLGGETTRHSATRTSFSFPAPNLSRDERRTFEVGDSLFNQNWVTAPASTDGRDGLGPVFNAQACSSCHVLDGRGVPPTPEGGTVPIGLLLRLSVPGETPTGAPAEHPVYGGQLQDRSILGVQAEGTVEVTFERVDGTYADGTPYTLVAPTFGVGVPQFGPLGADTMISPRLAPQVIGMGLLEAIPEGDLIGAADPDDADRDGISGRPNFVWDEDAGGPVLGRFGWKANVATVEQQVAGAFHGDLGITSSAHPEQDCAVQQDDCAAAISGGDPELTDDQLANVTFYGRTLSVPAMRDVESMEVREGAALFESFGCASCHAPTHVTGDSDVEALADQEIHPYTDLLLHDMGPGLADGRPDFEATGQEWRTPPLWGIGLVDDIAGSRFLLHDGRAASIEEAILWHGGEGADAATAFREAAIEDRRRLVAFVEAL
jgi:CxxC motif-containing protein (DUF1111 family)